MRQRYLYTLTKSTVQIKTGFEQTYRLLIFKHIPQVESLNKKEIKTY